MSNIKFIEGCLEGGGLHLNKKKTFKVFKEMSIHYSNIEATYTTTEAAKVLGTTRQTICEKAEKGEFPSWVWRYDGNRLKLNVGYINELKTLNE